MARVADPLLADRRRRQIMDAAIYCFRLRGFHQATMQEICAEAQISAGALYRYFGSKAEIISAIAEEHRAEADQAFLRRAETSGFLPAITEASREFFMKTASGHGALVGDILAEAIRDDALGAPLRMTDARSVKLFAKAIAAAQQRGEIDRKHVPEVAANVLFGAIEGIGLRRAFLKDADADDAVVQFRDLAERYLSPREPR